MNNSQEEFLENYNLYLDKLLLMEEDNLYMKESYNELEFIAIGKMHQDRLKMNLDVYMLMCTFNKGYGC